MNLQTPTVTDGALIRKLLDAAAPIVDLEAPDGAGMLVVQIGNTHAFVVTRDTNGTPVQMIPVSLSDALGQLVADFMAEALVQYSPARAFNLHALFIAGAVEFTVRIDPAYELCALAVIDCETRKSDALVEVRWKPEIVH